MRANHHYVWRGWSVALWRDLHRCARIINNRPGKEGDRLLLSKMTPSDLRERDGLSGTA